MKKISNDSILRTSPYVHFYTANKIFSAYHSLKIKNIFGREMLRDILDSFRKPFRVRDFLNKCTNGKIRIAARELIFFLYQEEYLKDQDDSSEEHYLNRLKKEASSPEIRFLYVVPTTRCNLRCKYCHILNNIKGKSHLSMSIKQARASLDVFSRFASKNQSSKAITFYGGEPLLNFSAVEAGTLHAKRLNEQGIINGSLKISLFTNATLMTDDVAKKLADLDVTTIVSLDGPREINDKTRVSQSGEGTFSAISKGLQLLKLYNCKFGISLVVNRHNSRDLARYVEYIFDKFGPLDIGLSTLHSFREGENPEAIPVKNSIEALLDVYLWTRERGFYAEHILRRVRPFVDRTVRLKDCPSCGGKLLINPLNQIGFCEAFMDVERYFYPIADFNLDNKDYKHWSTASPVMRAKCKRCPAIGICGGGCPYDAWVSKGDIHALDTYRCEQSKYLLDWLINDLSQLAAPYCLDYVSYFVPTDKQRRSLYGNIVQNNTIPLQAYSRFGESI